MREFILGTMYWVNPQASRKEFESDMAAIRQNGFSLVRIIAWWELIEKIEGDYDFTHLDRVFRAAESEGLLLMPTIGFYPPVWLARKLDKEGKNDPGRYPVVMRPQLQEPLSKLIEALVARYRSSPALYMWNIWNEPTVNSTVNRIRLERFARWLGNRYASLGQLRQAWCGEYPVFSLLCPESMDELTADWLEHAFRYGTRGRNAVIRYDWLHFLASELNAEAQWLSDEVRRHDTSHPIHSNLHSMSSNPLQDGRDLFALANVLETVSCSIHTSNDYQGGKEFYSPVQNYAFGVAQCYSWSKGRKHSMVGELQAGTTDSHFQKYTPEPFEIRYELCQALAEGLDGVIFWLWRGWKAGTFELGEFGLRAQADGAPTQRSEEVRRFSENCRKHQSILESMKRPKAHIALLCSQETYAYRMVLNEDRPFGLQNETQYALFGCFRALQEANYQVDFVSEEEVQNGSLRGYAMLCLPMVEVIGKATAEAIIAFVAGGGAVYADGRCGWLDERMYVRNAIPGNGLTQMFGATEADYVMSREPASVRIGEFRVTGTQMIQRLRPMDGAKAVGFFSDGSVAVVDHCFGRGKARLAGSGFSRRLYDYADPATADWIASFAAEASIVPQLKTPRGVICKHLQSDSHDFWFLYNGSGSIASVSIPGGEKCIGWFDAKAEKKGFCFQVNLPLNAVEVFLVEK